MREIETDVCVCGGGPAGLTLALLLARSGVDVVVVERSSSLNREYRGEIIQPGGLRALDELGVLAGVRERGGYRMQHFQLVEGEKTLLDIDYATLPAPYDHLLSLPQRLLLEELSAACAATPGFRQLDGRSCVELLRDGGAAVTGVRCGTGEKETVVRARWSVGADGRYSKTRTLAGIDYERFQSFQHDVAWFKLTGAELTGAVRIHRTGGDPVLVHDSYPDKLQLGWTLPHGGYRAVAAKGIGHVRAELSAALPRYAGLIGDQLTALNQLSPLDVFSGRARRWVTDGVVLIGDAAHTHSPIGAQGINLAIADAVALHPALVAALRAGDSSAGALAGFEKERAAAVRTVFRLQARQSAGMLSTHPVVNAVRPAIAKVLPRTPLFRKILNLVAFGSRPRAVRTDLFSAPTPSGGNP